MKIKQNVVFFFIFRNLTSGLSRLTIIAVKFHCDEVSVSKISPMIPPSQFNIYENRFKFNLISGYQITTHHCIGYNSLVIISCPWSFSDNYNLLFHNWNSADIWNPSSWKKINPTKSTLMARFMGQTWGPSVADRTQVGHMLAPWTVLAGNSTAADGRPSAAMLFFQFTQNIPASVPDRLTLLP